MPESAVIVQMRQFKRDLLQGERAQMQEMAQRWLGVERRLSAQIDALAYEMERIKANGSIVSQELLLNNVRYRELMIQLQDELARYSNYAEVQITQQQRRLTRLGIAHAENAIRGQGFTAAFNRLPVEAVQNIAGLAGNGSPLNSLLVASWPLSAQRLTQELVNGVALGYNPRKTARNMAQGMGASLDRMMVIARTEQMRVYRYANVESYRASGVVTGYKRLATQDRRTCLACLVRDGELIALGDEMDEHPVGRCTCVPVVDGLRAPTWQVGKDWLRDQPASVQVEIMGKGRYQLWQSGQVGLDEMATTIPNAIWGDSLAVTPVRELQGV